MADVIGVESLTKQYGDLVAVDDISFSVRRGEVFGILGPNGAGKTTTLECIEGLLTPTAGSISVLGMDIAADAERIKSRIGVQLQASAYFDYLTLREILDLFALIYRSSASPDDLLAAVGLEDKADTTVAKLSGGQQQRFTIAATLVNDPELLFLDEPTAGLDPKGRRDLWDFVQTANRQGRTIVITTHYMEEAEFLCDRVAIMDRGKIVALATPDDLVRSLPAPYRISVGLDNGHRWDGRAGVSRLRIRDAERPRRKRGASLVRLGGHHTGPDGVGIEYGGADHAARGHARQPRGRVPVADGTRVGRVSRGVRYGGKLGMASMDSDS